MCTRWGICLTVCGHLDLLRTTMAMYQRSQQYEEVANESRFFTDRLSVQTITHVGNEPRESTFGFSALGS